MGMDNLKLYIKKVYELEASLYNQQAFVNLLRGKIDALERVPDKPLVQSPANSVVDSETVLGSLALGEFIGIIIGEILAFIFSDENQAWNKMIIGLGWGAVIGLLISGLFLWFFTSSAQEADVRVWKQNEQIMSLNERNKKIRERVIQQFEKEIKCLNRSYNETLNVLEQYYSLGIIYKKYQNFIAVSSFYEYLDSGRCMTLEGHEGAYNIFETELRQNVIIGKLDEVIRCLNRIAENQGMLYSAIQKSNHMLNGMSNELKRISSNLTTIEESSAVTAYNSRISAENTEFIKWFEILKNG